MSYSCTMSNVGVGMSCQYTDSNGVKHNDAELTEITYRDDELGIYTVNLKYGTGGSQTASDVNHFPCSSPNTWGCVGELCPPGFGFGRGGG